MEDKKSSTVTQLVFAFTFAIVILNVVSLIFPALLLTSFDYVERSINPFELGSWTIPFFVVNLSILTFSVLYYRKHLPDKITSAFKFILSFEISRRTSIVAFAIIVGIYIIF